MWDHCKREVISHILQYNSRVHANFEIGGTEFVSTESNNGNLQIGVQG